MSSKKGRKIKKERRRIPFREDGDPVVRYATTRLPAVKSIADYGAIRKAVRLAKT
jgi:hypothetical protein